jgi:hypothetical protein
MNRRPAIDEGVARNREDQVRAKDVAVLATCEDCGTVRLPALDCALLHCRDTDDYTVSFACPGCGRRSVSDCGRVRVAELVAAGIAIAEWHFPDELDDPVRASATQADRDAILELLADESWLEALDGQL